MHSHSVGPGRIRETIFKALGWLRSTVRLEKKHCYTAKHSFLRQCFIWLSQSGKLRIIILLSSFYTGSSVGTKTNQFKKNQKEISLYFLSFSFKQNNGTIIIDHLMNNNDTAAFKTSFGLCTIYKRAIKQLAMNLIKSRQGIRQCLSSSLHFSL